MASNDVTPFKRAVCWGEEEARPPAPPDVEASSPSRPVPRAAPQRPYPPPRKLVARTLRRLTKGATKAASVHTLGTALDRLRHASTRHDDLKHMIKQVRKQSEDAEPPVGSQAELRRWRVWAKQHAEVAAEARQPRIGGQRLPVFCSSKDLMQAIGVTPSLYFDFLIWALAFSSLGFLFSLPSLIASSFECAYAYSAASLTGMEALACTSLGARTTCATSLCKFVNLLVPILELCHAALLLGGVRKFRNWVHGAEVDHQDANVLTQEYAIQLYGLPANCKPQQVQTHLQVALREWLHRTLLKAEAYRGGKLHEARLERLRELWRVECWKVWGVALIVNYERLLQDALKEAPLEKRAMLLHKKLEILDKLREEKNGGWAVSEQRGKLEGDLQQAARELLKVRKTIESKGFEDLQEVCGAFVIFEHQAAARLAQKLFHGGLISLCRQKHYLRYPVDGPPAVVAEETRRDRGGLPLDDAMALADEPKAKTRRLVALGAPHPMDVFHENLPSRLGNLPRPRSFFTLGRRIVSFLIISTALVVSCSAVILVTTYKNSVIVTSGTYSSSELAISQGLSNLSTLIVVVVNLLLERLAGFLGKFERHETLSGMRRMKVIIITISQTINLAFVALAVSAAVPSDVLRSIEQDGWMCWSTGPNGAMCGETQFCCLLGPTGLLVRGTHLTLDVSWHQGVGAPIVAAMILATGLGLVFPFLPAVLHRCKKRAWKRQVTLIEMKRLCVGPEMDLPEAIGKAFAFFFVITVWGVALPLLYPISMIYFGGMWVVMRYTVLRIHRVPPAYSVSLIHDTLWWVEIAVFFKLFFGCWAYANVPSDPYGADVWRPPFGTASSEVLASISGTTNSTASLGYNIPGHINSYGTLLLIAGALVIVAKIGLDASLRLLSWVVPVPQNTSALWKKMCKRIGRARKLLSASVEMDDHHGNDEDESVTDHLEVDGDPIFSKALEGVSLHKVRTHKGYTVHESNVIFSKFSYFDFLAYINPLKVLFDLFGLKRKRLRLTEDEWKAAKELPVRLEGAHNISYEPEFSPLYAKAYEYLTPDHILVFKTSDAESSEREDDPESGAAGDVEEATAGKGEQDSDEESDSSQELTTEALYYMRKHQSKQQSKQKP